MSRKKNVTTYIAIVLCALMLIFALTLLFCSGGNALKEVVILRVNSENTIADISDERIIRESGLVMGEKIPDIEELAKTVENGVNSIGYIKFLSIKRTSREAVEITVDVRKPFALIDAVGNKVLIDKDGYVITHLNEIPAYDIMYVTGVDPFIHIEGRLLATRRASQLNDLLVIATAISDAGYQKLFTEINVADDKDFRLVTDTGMIVSFYTINNIQFTLEQAKGVIDQGHVGGRVIISGDFADYRPLVSDYAIID